jgi:uncharacterized membrane protein
VRALYAACGAFALAYFALDLNRLYALRYGADLGTYVQMLVNLRHGSSWNGAEWLPHFQVHDSWALALLVPLVAVVPRSETLLAVQSVAVAAAAIPLAIFGRRIGLGTFAATALGCAYLLSPAAQGLVYDNFSENVFVPLLVFSGALAVARRSLLGTLLAAQLLMGIKEDEILFVAWFALVGAIFWDRRIGLAAFALAVVNGAAFWGIEALRGIAPHDPGYSLQVHDLSGKLAMCALLLAPFAFAPLRAGRWLWLGLPLLAEIFFARPWAYEISRVGSHWTAPLLAATALAAAFGALRSPAFARAMIPCAALVTLFFNDTVLHAGRWPYIVDWHAYDRATALRDSGRAALLPRRDEGVWAVAAINPNVRLERRPDPHFVACPGYNTNAGAFFASLRGKMPPALCGGVPVSR